MKRFNVFSNRWLLYKVIGFVIIFFANITAGCANQQREYRAYIDQMPNWQMKEVCGFEGCYPMVDVLFGYNMSMRLDFYKIQGGKLIFALLRFSTTDNDIIINPENITAAINNGNILPVKVFKCSEAIWDLKALRLMPQLTGKYKIKGNDCFLVFFDYQQLGDQSISMRMNKVFTSNSTPIYLPTIYFKPNPNYKQ